MLDATCSTERHCCYGLSSATHHTAHAKHPVLFGLSLLTVRFMYIVRRVMIHRLCAITRKHSFRQVSACYQPCVVRGALQKVALITNVGAALFQVSDSRVTGVPDATSAQSARPHVKASRFRSWMLSVCVHAGQEAQFQVLVGSTVVSYT